MQASTQVIEDKILLHYITAIAPRRVTFKQFADTAYSNETGELALGTIGSETRRNYQRRLDKLKNKVSSGTAEIDSDFELEVSNCRYLLFILS